MKKERFESTYDQDIELDHILAEVGVGYKLVVRRIEPDWCDGHLGTIELDPHEPISMDYLRKKFGGRKITFKIMKPNGDYVCNRTVKFPDEPLHDGVVMVQGQPWGAAQRPTQGNGGQPVNGNQQMEKMFEMVLNSQRETSKMMIDSLSGRVNQLEASLQTAQDRANGVTPAPVEGQTPDPFGGIKESIKTIQEIEKFKEAIGVGEKQEPSMMETSLEKIMDFMLKKEEQKMEAAFNRQAQTTGAPPLGDASQYVPPATTGSDPIDKIVKGLDSITDVELAAYVKKRLENMPEKDRMELISQVADIDLIEEEGDEGDNGQEIVNEVQDQEGLPGVELTEQDAERLDGENDATPEPPLGPA